MKGRRKKSPPDGQLGFDWDRGFPPDPDMSDDIDTGLTPGDPGAVRYDPKYKADWDRRKKADRFAKGLCTACGKRPPKIGFRTCQSCTARGVKRKQERKKARAEQGVCVNCKNPPKSGMKHCADCLSRANEHRKKLLDRFTSKGYCWRCRKQPVIPGLLYCQECRNKHLAKARALKQEVLDAYGGCRCVCCGETDIAFLTLDHIHGNGREHRREIGGVAMYSWVKTNGYPPLFQVLCFNCNIAKFRLGTCPHQSKSRDDIEPGSSG